jgi:leader peptidase (prepilin peptidase)/N-methyltransferase
MNWSLLISEHFTASIIFAAIFGAIIGSFLNVIIYRYPIMLMREWDDECRTQLNLSLPNKKDAFNLCVPQSHCPQCQKHIPFWHNIPILSFILLRGKCAYCHVSIPIQYFLVEIIAAFMTAFIFLHFALTLQAAEVLIFTYGLIVLSFIDINHQFLPDPITYILLWLGLIASTQHYFTCPTDAILGAIIGYLFLWAIAKIYILLRKKEGMGLGDCKLLAVMGAWGGPGPLINILLISTLLAIIVSGILMLFKKMTADNMIPFGPYIAICDCRVVYCNLWAFIDAMDCTMRTVKPLCIGLTGGIGSGKTTVANFFKALGVPIIDADEIAHALTATDAIGYEKIVAHFGPDILVNKIIDRKKLREIVFNNPAEKKWLENCLHPLIRTQMRDAINAVKYPYCICVIPLLTESTGIDFIDRILVIDTPIDLQIARAKKRDSATAADIQKIINAQASQKKRLAIADDVVINDGDLKSLEQKAYALHAQYLKGS